MEEKTKHEGLLQAVKAFSVLGGVGIYLGNLADETFALGAKGKFTGILVGFPCAIYTLFRQLKRMGLV